MPMFAALTVMGSGAPELSQSARPFADPAGVSACVPRIWYGGVSLKNVTLATFGFTSGTPTGSAPAVVSFCRIETRAWALMNGTRASRKNHGRSVSVIFTSTITAEHGGEGFTVESTGDDWL